MGKECIWGDYMKDCFFFGYVYVGFLIFFIIVCMIFFFVIYVIIGYSLKRYECRIRVRFDKNYCDLVKLNCFFCLFFDFFKYKFFL